MNPIRTATVVTHRRPSEVAPALDLLFELAQEAGAVLRFDAEETRKHGLAERAWVELSGRLR